MNITNDLANAIAAYLGTRPYQEVVNLIAELQKQAQQQEQKNEPIDPTPEV